MNPAFTLMTYTMGTMVYSLLLWVMQDFVHQPFRVPFVKGVRSVRSTKGFRGLGLRV